MNVEDRISYATRRPPLNVKDMVGKDAELVDLASHSASLRTTLLAVFGYRQLLKHLVLKDLKLKYRGSVLGFLWSLLNPLLMLTIYTVAFKYIMGMTGEGFVFLLMIAILTWTFFTGSMTMSAGAIVDNGGLLKTVFFPRAVLPMATVLFNLAQFLLTAAVFLPVLAIVFQRPPGPPALLFPVFVALQLLMTVGLALTLATATTFFRDLRHLLDIGLAVIFWTTPVVYNFRAIPEVWQRRVIFSPLAPFVLAYQDILYYGTWPPNHIWAIAIAYAVCSLVAGVLLFTHLQDRFVERI